MAPVAEPHAPDSRPSQWIGLGLLAAACVLWATFRHGARVAALSSAAGVPLSVEAVPVAGVAVAVAVAIGCFLLRRKPLGPRTSFGWLYFGAALVTAVAAVAIAREVEGRPVTLDALLVAAAVAAALLAGSWRAHRRSRARER